MDERGSLRGLPLRAARGARVGVLSQLTAAALAGGLCLAAAGVKAVPGSASAPSARVASSPAVTTSPLVASAPVPNASGANARAATSARVQALAPDFAARAERARKAALAESDPAARSESSERVAWLERAAEVEADRVELARKLSALEQRMAAAISTQATIDRERAAAERARAIDALAMQAQAEADHVFAVLANAPTGESDRVQAFLLRRAELLLSAARVLGADGPQLKAAGRRLDGARAAPAAQRLRQAQDAHASAAIALGDARKRVDVVSPAQRLDLRARARERGFEVEDTPAGLNLRLPGAFAAGETRLRPVQQRRLQLLSDVLPAFPQGGVRIACGASSGLEQARAASVIQLLGAAPDQRARLNGDAAAGVPAADELLVVLPAYAIAR